MPVVTRREISAGGVLVRHVRGKDEVCLILRDRHGRPVWGLPKGHLEPGEDAAAAAQREVREETGWDGAIAAPLGDVRYTFTATGRGMARVQKRVTFFLMRVRRGPQVAPDRTEVLDARWMSLAAARRRVRYATERRILHRAQTMLNARVLSPLSTGLPAARSLRRGRPGVRRRRTGRRTPPSVAGFARRSRGGRRTSAAVEH